MRTIIGIDPGSAVTGYGVILPHKNQLTVVEYGVISTSPQQPLCERIFHELTAIIARLQPSEAAMETLFYSKNVRAALTLGHARGVEMLALRNAEISIAEYSPREIKQSVTGNGNASKQQVQFMVQRLLSLKEKPQPLDASDGLAIAICHYFRNG